ncbi:Type IV secretion system, TraD, DNA-binding domain protein (plasmid) [Thalassoporum mexicanum PCC 7367]|uniref:type IV secretory system conjugative DNA transfer family protein n=1 Tax=Thalassoporum mexicanum TaxID=3457544 RepID=UPI00029FC32B|nr:type IV secretion system DNA-binding domain-containing protein [Pseudanabaena sp. PCC 7367]AFY71979.1 Type IV secretion system, TraD, DNA-binding domain protein [Pseudanabaena sp. PCC 7367]
MLTDRIFASIGSGIIFLASYATLIYLVIRQDPHPLVSGFIGALTIVMGVFQFFSLIIPAVGAYASKGEDGVQRYWIAFFVNITIFLSVAYFFPYLAFVLIFFLPPILASIAFDNYNRAQAVKGRGLINYKMAHRQNQRALPEGDSGLYWGGIAVPTQSAMTHFLVVGASGSGKTITLRLWMQSFLPALASRGRAMIYDAKLDVISILKGMNVRCPTFILNPFDARCVAWDMSGDIITYADIEALAHILIPEEGHKEDPFFRSAVVELVKGVARFFVLQAPGVWTLRDIILTLRSLNTMKTLFSSRPELDFYLELISDKKTAQNIMATVLTKIGRYETVAALWHWDSIYDRPRAKISLTSWSRSNSILVFGKSNTARESLNAINQLIFTRAAQILLDKPEVSHPETFIIFDELPSAGRMDMLPSLCTEGRSKGVSLAIGFQSIKHLEDIYNENIAQTIIGQFRHKAILRLDDPPTAEWASQLVGEVEIRRILEGFSSNRESGGTRSWNESYERHRAVMPSEFLEIWPIDRQTGQGLTGYYLTGNSVYKHYYPTDFISKHLIPSTDSRESFIPRPTNDQVLRPWDSEDLERLNIAHLIMPHESLLSGDLVDFDEFEEDSEDDDEDYIDVDFGFEDDEDEVYELQ